MTRQERRIAELAAQDLEDWARELPVGSETRQDLQQYARAYRFAVRTAPPELRALPGGRAQQTEAPNARPVAFEERVELTTAPRPAAPEHVAAARRRPVALLNGLRGALRSPTAP